MNPFLFSPLFRVVRRFTVSARLTSIVFSPDSRWLLAAQANGQLRVFDLPSGRLVDWLAFDRPLASVAFSPRCDMIATTHVGSLGVFLWVNRGYFSSDFIALAVPSKPSAMQLRENADPNNSAPAESAAAAASASQPARKKRRVDAAEVEGVPAAAVDASSDGSDGGDSESDEDSSRSAFDPVAMARREPVDPDQLHSSVFGELVTLSGLPPSRWQQLSMLEHVRKRNKPSAGQVTTNTEAPFFLTVKTGVAPSLDASDAARKYQEAKQQQETAAMRYS